MRDHKLIKGILFTLIIIFLIIGIKGISIYRKAYIANVEIPEKFHDLYIPTGSSYEDVVNILEQEQLLINLRAFQWAAERKNYPKHIYPGHYKIKNRMTNNQLINLLRSGSQVPVNVTFNNIRFLDQLADVISEQLEAGAASIFELLTDKVIIEEYGFDSNTIKCMFIPNTYEFYWNTDAKGFVDRMRDEYSKFWNETRLKKAEEIGLTPDEVGTLASIIDEETKKNDEKSRIAGVYINRLNKRIRLGADPTIIYAIGDYTINRVLNKHREVDSPWNTYKNYGLPPGPIRIPSISSMDAVLNYEKHDYIYFCAKDDFSGYHVFAKTLTQHNRNAALYHQALNQRKIFR